MGRRSRNVVKFEINYSRHLGVNSLAATVFRLELVIIMMVFNISSSCFMEFVSLL